MPFLKCFRMFSDVQLPTAATAGSACMDVRAYFGNTQNLVKRYTPGNIEGQSLAIAPHANAPVQLAIRGGERVLIPTGLKFEIPVGYSVRVHPRSGLSLKQGLSLSNCEGVIDSDYVEQLYISIINLSSETVLVNHGDRVAQIELVRNETMSLEEISNAPSVTTRDGGFGSSGVQ